MTVALGSQLCGVTGCRRERHVSPTGIHYGHCIAHSEELLARAFAPDRSASSSASPLNPLGSARSTKRSAVSSGVPVPLT